VLLLACVRVDASGVPQPRFLDVTVNGVSQPSTMLLMDDREQFFASLEDLRLWRIDWLPQQSVNHRGRRYFALHAIVGTRIDYDARQLSLHVHLPAHVFKLSEATAADSHVRTVARSTGAYLDYDLSYTHAGSSSVAALLSPTLFFEPGSLEADFVYQQHSTDAVDGWQRLGTTFTHDDAEHMRSFRFGDVISMPDPWGGAYRLGGIQIASNFSTRPTFATFPLPSLQGAARAPSAVDVFVNDKLRYQQQVDAGGFRINQIPAITGAGDARMVITDMLGRQTVINTDFYVSSALLRKGLTEYSYSLGVLRKGFGTVEDEYDQLSFVAAHRFGLSDQLTLGGQLQVNKDIALMSLSADIAVSGHGVLRAGIGGSSDAEGDGAALRLGYEFNSRAWHIGAEATGTSEQFRLLDNETAAAPPRYQLLLNGGWHTNYGSIGMTVVRQDYRDRDSRLVFSISHSRVTPGGFALGIRASYQQDADTDYGISMTLTRAFGDRRSAYSSSSVRRDAWQVRAETTLSVPRGPGIGYRLGATFGDSNQVDAVLIGQTDAGQYSLEVQSFDDEVIGRINTQGSIAWLAGRPFFTRELGAGFAVASTNGYPDVRVYLENQEVGRSDRHGMIVLPSLRPYEVNRVRLEPNDLPLGAVVKSIELEVIPVYRSGSIARFNVGNARSVRFRARMSDGTPLAEGSIGRVAGRKDILFIGLDGTGYLAELVKPIDVDMQLVTGPCRLSIPFPATTAHQFADLGDLTCWPIG